MSFQSSSVPKAMEAEDDDFGELYYDVLKPFTLLPSLNATNAGVNRTDDKLEIYSTNSADIKCSINDGVRLQDAEKSDEVVGTVRLEIYLGSRRVFENKFVFPVGGSGIELAEVDSGFNQSGNLVTDDGRKEMTSVRGYVNHLQSEPSYKIVDCEAEGDLNTDPEHISDSSQSDRGRTVEVGDSNSDPEPGRKSNEKSSGTPKCQKENRVDGTSSVDTHDLCTGIEPCKGEPSEEGQLSEYAELDSDRETAIRAATWNSAEEVRIAMNRVQVLNATATPIVPHQMTTSRPYRHQAKTKFPDMSASLFDLDLNSLEPKPWRRPNEDISDYFNFGLDEASWNSYCEEMKAMRSYKGNLIQAEHGVRDRLPSVKAIPPHQQNSTSTIQREHIKSYHRPAFEQIGEGPSGSQLGKQNTHQTIFAGMKANESGCYDHNMGYKRAKVIEEASRGSSSNMSDNEWMCRHVGMDSWFRPISLPEQQSRRQETSRKGSRRGRSKLERWTRHDQDNDDENTSTSSL